jgi:hypothetical protein
LRCLAQTRPSPPLFPGPDTIRTSPGKIVFKFKYTRGELRETFTVGTFNGLSTAQTSQFHQLINGKGKSAEEFLVNGNGLLLAKISKMRTHIFNL